MPSDHPKVASTTGDARGRRRAAANSERVGSVTSASGDDLGAVTAAPRTSDGRCFTGERIAASGGMQP